MNPIDKITEYFTKFPGIGPRQARRFAYFLLSKDPTFIRELGASLASLQNEMAQCSSCYRFFQKQIDSKTMCPICEDPKREKGSLLVVEKDVDFENIHKAGIWNGLYFVLGGSLPVLEKEPTKKIRSRDLFNIVQTRAQSGHLHEVVLATSANTEGENTAQYLMRILEPLAEKYELDVTALGRGLSTGTELEYSDSDTLKNAIESRR